MSDFVQDVAVSRGRCAAGVGLSTLAVLFLLFDSVIKPSANIA